MNAEESLLIGAHDHETYNSIGNEIDHNKRLSHITTRSETIFIIKSMGPLAVTFFLQSLLTITSIFATGKLGPQELAASTLAVCTFNITGLAVYQGMSTCLDTFCSQAYGAGEPLKVGVYFQRCSLMILAVTIFPLSFIWWFSGSILKLMVPDEELALLAQTYLRILIFGAPGLVFFETGKRFLQAQHIFNAGGLVLLIIAPVNFILNWLLVYHPRTGLGYIGAPIAVSIIYWLTAFLLFMYVVIIDGRQCWNGLDLKGAICDWSPMFSLALPGVVMVAAEYLAFEILTIFAASFGTNSLAAQSIASNVAQILFQIPFAASVASTTRIGHYIGMGQVKAAKLVVRISLLISGCLGLFNFAICFFFRHPFGKLLTSSNSVLRISDKVLILVAINQIMDNFNVMAAGILRGQGRQKMGSFLNLICYYCIAVPVGYTLGIVYGMELNGLWLGILLGVMVLALSELSYIWKSDWASIIICSRQMRN